MGYRQGFASAGSSEQDLVPHPTADALGEFRYRTRLIPLGSVLMTDLKAVRSLELAVGFEGGRQSEIHSRLPLVIPWGRSVGLPSAASTLRRASLVPRRTCLAMKGVARKKIPGK